MTSTGKANILIVDDLPENLLALENLLQELDVNIIKATSGNQALEVVWDSDLALILLDVHMPELDGFQTAELMRGVEKSRYIPIIFLTAVNRDQQYVFKGYEIGAVDYLYKPIIPEILQSKVKVFSQLYLQRQEIQTLRGLLSICSGCKKIRNEIGEWENLESYVETHSDAQFTHSMCKECVKRLYPGYYDKKFEPPNGNCH